MSKLDDFSAKLNAEWTEFTKQFAKASNQTANETAGAAAEVLKGLSKELSTLGDRLEKWVESAKQAPAADAPKPENKETPAS